MGRSPHSLALVVMSLGALLSSLGAGIPNMHLQVQAQELELSEEASDDCTPLKEVSTGQTEIRKQIKNEIFGDGNWNTDFAVPGEENFDFFVAIFTPENDARYQGAIFFKYGDNSTATVLSAERELKRNETYSQILVSPTARQPFQINARIGGQSNTVYRIAFLGCKVQDL